MNVFGLEWRKKQERTVAEVHTLPDYTQSLHRLKEKEILQERVNRRVVQGVSQVENTMEQILEIIRKIAEDAEQQATFLERSIEAVNQTAAFSQQVAVSTGHAGEVSDHALNAAQQGKHAVDRTIEHMHSIQQSVENVQHVVLELQGKMKKIETILDAIKKIANQTNLLALNAAIEAARAGEQGRGFSIVAGEVKQLANKSAQFTGEIEELLEEIQNYTRNSVKAMEDSTTEVMKGVSVARETAETIDKIVMAVGSSNQVTSEINEAAHEQAQNIEFLLRTIDDMEQAAQRVINLTETATMDTQFQRASVGHLKTLAKKFEEISYHRNQLVTDLTKEVPANQTRIRVVNNGKPKQLDPNLSNDHSSITIIANTHLGLVRFGEDTEIIPAAARSWHLEEDGVTWSFLLKKGILFHNGAELKAHDFKYTIERILHPRTQSPNTWLFNMIDGAKEFMRGEMGHIRGIQILDDYRLTITLESPYNPFILNLAQTAASIIPRGSDLQAGDRPYQIGAGPYKIKEITDTGCILEAFDAYYEGRAFVDEVEVLFQLENSGPAMERGEVDLMPLGKASYQHLRNLTQFKNLIRIENGYGTYYIGFNLQSKNPLVQSVKARQALNYCLNKEEIIQEIVGGLASVSKGPLPPTILHDPGLQGYPYNLAKAKALLEEAGFKGAQKGQLVLHSTQRRANANQVTMADVLARQFQTVGIDLKVDEVASEQYLKPETFKNCDIFIYGWIGDSGDPDNFLQPLFNINNSTNFCRYNNPELEQMMNEAVNIKNPAKRRELYCKIQKVIVEDAPWIFMYHITNNYVYSPRTKGARMHPIGFYRFNDIWVE